MKTMQFLKEHIFKLPVIIGIFGMLLCTGAVGKFISKAPFHLFTILGYILGTIALFILMTQIFNWNIPIIRDSRSAAILLIAIIIIKIAIAQCASKYLHFLVKKL